MVTSSNSNGVSTKGYSEQSSPAKARLISKGFDQPSTRIQPSNKGGRKAPFSKRSSKVITLSRKPYGKFQKKFKRNAPSNYEANVAVTHGISLLPLKKEKFLPQQKVKGSTPAARRRPIVGYNDAVEQQLPVIRRIVVHRGQLNTPGSTTPSPLPTEKLTPQYTTVRYLLAGAPRARALVKVACGVAKTSRVLRWSAKKRSAALYAPDARELGRRARRKGKPRVGLTPLRAVLARQLVRKFRASRSAKHSAVRRRLTRFRWFNRKYLKSLRYPARRRMLKRSIRRASRYLQTSVAVLSAAAQRHAVSRKLLRTHRLLTQRTIAGADYLLTYCPVPLTARQRLFAQRHLARKARASRFLKRKTRFMHSTYRVKNARSFTQAYRAARSLKRKLITRPAARTLTPRHYRFSDLLFRRTAARSSR